MAQQNPHSSFNFSGNAFNQHTPNFFMPPQMYFPALMLQNPAYFGASTSQHRFPFPPPQAPWMPPLDLKKNIEEIQPTKNTKNVDNNKVLNLSANLKKEPTTVKPIEEPKKRSPESAEIAVGVDFAPQGDQEEKEYAEFRKKILAQLNVNHCRTNENMRRYFKGDNQKEQDPAYLERRRKNNEAAKRSRDARKMKEDEIAIRCAYLEQINLKLKLKFAQIEKERKTLMASKNHLKR